MFRLCFGRQRHRDQTDDVLEDETDDLSRRNIRKFSFASLQIATNNFALDRLIGEGGSARIYKGLLPDGRVVAIKRYKEAKPRKQEDFLHMVELMSHIRHRNINQVIGCCMENGYRLIASEFAENGSVADLLQDPVKKESVFDWYKRAAICIGIARGLSYLHEDVHPRVIHRDIKPSNILLDSNLAPKIADFDIVNLLDDGDETYTTSTVIGTAAYMAPEYVMTGRYTEKVDVYAFGMIMLEIISGRKVISRELDADDRYIIGWASKLANQGRVLEIVDPALRVFPSDEAQRFTEVALSCTQMEPHQRPRMHEAVLMLHGVCNSCSQALRKFAVPMSDDGSSFSADRHVGESTAAVAATEDGLSSILQDGDTAVWTDDESAVAPAVSSVEVRTFGERDVTTLVDELMTTQNNISQNHEIVFAQDEGAALLTKAKSTVATAGSSSMVQAVGGFDVRTHVGDLITVLNNMLRSQGVEMSIVQEHTDSAKVQGYRAIGTSTEAKETKDGEIKERTFHDTTVPIVNDMLQTDRVESSTAQEHRQQQHSGGTEEKSHVAAGLETEIRRSDQLQENMMPGIILSGSGDIMERLSQTMVFKKHSQIVCMEAVYPPFLTGVYRRKRSTCFKRS